MRKIRMAIIGAGREGSSLFYCFRMKPNVKIVGIADVTGQGFAVDDAAAGGIMISDSLEEIMALDEIDVVLETTKQPEIAERVHRLKGENTQVIEASSLDLIVTLGNKKEKAEAELLSILGSVNDAVKIADNNGIITYVNSAFERVTGLNAHEVIGHSIQERFPDSPVACVLESKQKISGQKYILVNGNKEFNYSVSPIVIRDEVVGAIGVFRAAPDVFNIMEELQRSTSIIEGLYDRLGQINGLSELNMSEVMPIDKMEQVMLRQALTKYGYSVEGKKKAAKALNISLATLYNKLKKYQIS